MPHGNGNDGNGNGNGNGNNDDDSNEEDRRLCRRFEAQTAKLRWRRLVVEAVDL